MLVDQSAKKTSEFSERFPLNLFQSISSKRWGQIGSDSYSVPQSQTKRLLTCLDPNLIPFHSSKGRLLFKGANILLSSLLVLCFFYLGERGGYN